MLQVDVVVYFLKTTLSVFVRYLEHRVFVLKDRDDSYKTRLGTEYVDQLLPMKPVVGGGATAVAGTNQWQ